MIAGLLCLSSGTAFGVNQRPTARRARARSAAAVTAPKVQVARPLARPARAAGVARARGRARCAAAATPRRWARSSC